MDVRLPRMVTTDQVYWSTNGNSFVVDPELNIWSINGIGEIRWKIESWNTDEESEAARKYFLDRDDFLRRDGIYAVGSYEIAAQLTVFEGGGVPWRQVVTVFHNHSSHYLVGWQRSTDDIEFVFVKSFPYDVTMRSYDEDEYKEAYAKALNLAIELAKEN